MNQNPTISVILSTYREPLAMVHQAIESIQQQTEADFECLVVIDDITNTPVRAYIHEVAADDPRFLIFENEYPHGLAYCRNEGIKHASGEYIALMDADDVALPTRLEREKAWLLQKHVDAVFSHVAFINEDGSPVGMFTPMTTHSRRDIFLKHVFTHPTGFLRKTVFETEHYDTAFLRAQDIDLWIRLLYHGYMFSIIPEVLLLYRIHRNASYQDRLRRQAGYAQYGFRIVQKHIHTFWKNLYFWIFAFKWSIYHMLFTCIPEKMLIAIMKMRDGLIRA